MSTLSGVILGKHSFSHPLHQRKNEIQTNQVRNTKLKKKKKKKTNNAYLMSKNHHQILENNGIEKNQYKVIKSR